MSERSRSRCTQPHGVRFRPFNWHDARSNAIHACETFPSKQFIWSVNRVTFSWISSATTYLQQQLEPYEPASRSFCSCSELAWSCCSNYLMFLYKLHDLVHLLFPSNTYVYIQNIYQKVAFIFQMLVFINKRTCAQKFAVKDNSKDNFQLPLTNHGVGNAVIVTQRAPPCAFVSGA